jgi:hypothetical protein
MPWLSDNDIAKSAGKIEAVKEAFRMAHTALMRRPASPETQLGRIMSISQLVLTHLYVG